MAIVDGTIAVSALGCAGPQVTDTSTAGDGVGIGVAVALVLTNVRSSTGLRRRRQPDVLLGTVRAFIGNMNNGRKLKYLREFCEDEALAPLAATLQLLLGEASHGVPRGRAPDASRLARATPADARSGRPRAPGCWLRTAIVRPPGARHCRQVPGPAAPDRGRCRRHHSQYVPGPASVRRHALPNLTARGRTRKVSGERCGIGAAAAGALALPALAGCGLSYRIINELLLLETARYLEGEGADFVTYRPPWSGSPADTVRPERGCPCAAGPCSPSPDDRHVRRPPALLTIAHRHRHRAGRLFPGPVSDAAPVGARQIGLRAHSERGPRRRR